MLPLEFSPVKVGSRVALFCITESADKVRPGSMQSEKLC